MALTQAPEAEARGRLLDLHRRLTVDRGQAALDAPALALLRKEAAYALRGRSLDLTIVHFAPERHATRLIAFPIGRDTDRHDYWIGRNPAVSDVVVRARAISRRLGRLRFSRSFARASLHLPHDRIRLGGLAVLGRDGRRRNVLAGEATEIQDDDEALLVEPQDASTHELRLALSRDAEGAIASLLLWRRSAAASGVRLAEAFLFARAPRLVLEDRAGAFLPADRGASVQARAGARLSIELRFEQGHVLHPPGGAGAAAVSVDGRRIAAGLPEPLPSDALIVVGSGPGKSEDAR